MPDKLPKITADEHLGRGYVQIPITVLLSDISPGAKVAYAGLCYYWWKNHPYPGHEQASIDWSIPRRSLERYLHELQAVGFIHCRRQGQGWPNHYHLPQPRLAILADQDVQFRQNGGTPHVNLAEPGRQSGGSISLDEKPRRTA